MSLSEATARQQIVEIGRLMYQKGWVAANDGNLSARLGPDRILATPTGISKGMMQPEDLVVCDTQARRVCGDRATTTEIAMHLKIYELRPDIGAVVHAHPPTATGFAAAGRALDKAILSEVVVQLGWVPLVPYALPGTPDVTERMQPWIPSFDALLLANHGAVCYGEDLMTAFFRMETLEHYARITLVAEQAGGAALLPRAEVDRLIASRGRYGVTSRSAMEPGKPVALEDVAASSGR